MGSADAHSLAPHPQEWDPWQQLPTPEVSDEVKAVAFLPLRPGGRHCEEKSLQSPGRAHVWVLTVGSELSLATEETAAWRDPALLRLSLDVQSCLPEVRGAGVAEERRLPKGWVVQPLDTHHYVPS